MSRFELYRVFPVDSTNLPSGNVPTRVNSPSDHESAAFDSAARDTAVTTTLLNSSFAVANTVVNGIHTSPNQFTGGRLPARRSLHHSVQYAHRAFAGSSLLPSGGRADERNFLWLSAPKPIVAPGTRFTPDLQTWIRDANLSGRDIISPNTWAIWI